MKKLIQNYFHYLSTVICIFVILFCVASGNIRETVTTYNVNNLKSIQAMRMANTYNSLSSQTVSNTTVYETFEEAFAVAQSGRVSSFIGKLTGYGPDCKGCGGFSACPPKQNFKNGNIYYDDSKYGKVRIVAADQTLPCGSIIRLSNIDIYNTSIVAIVMDRGSSVNGKHLDLLFETEKDMQGMHTQDNIQFDILRLGF